MTDVLTAKKVYRDGDIDELKDRAHILVTGFTVEQEAGLKLRRKQRAAARIAEEDRIAEEKRKEEIRLRAVILANERTFEFPYAEMGIELEVSDVWVIIQSHAGWEPQSHKFCVCCCAAISVHKPETGRKRWNECHHG